MNVWHVSVRGRYERFEVRIRRGLPGNRLSYVRDGGSVRIDVDGDADRELLGRADRVAFETGTTVLVVVPPNGRGVGDTDGQMVEMSPG